MTTVTTIARMRANAPARCVFGISPPVMRPACGAVVLERPRNAAHARADAAQGTVGRYRAGLPTPVSDLADKRPSVVAIPGVHESAGSIDEDRQRLIFRDRHARGRRWGPRSKRHFPEERFAFTVCRIPARSVLPARALNKDQPELVAARVLRVQRTWRFAADPLRFGDRRGGRNRSSRFHCRGVLRFARGIWGC